MRSDDLRSIAESIALKVLIWKQAGVQDTFPTVLVPEIAAALESLLKNPPPANRLIEK